jgi:pyruvate dehydrogenase E2 component (dihydrolipoamide acetyltransferase)
MPDIVMPRLSDTMEEGTILRWLKRDGEEVKRGEELVEIETDKATMTYESDQSGTLQTIAQEGATLAVGELIARIGAAQGAAATQTPAADTHTAAAAAQAPAAAEHAPAEPAPASPAQTLAPESPGEGGRVKASPLARRIANQRGVELQGLSGSGPGGRIVKADVEGFADAAGAPEAVRAGAAAPAPPDGAGASASATLAGVSTAKGESTSVELSRTQQTIARRMAESRATIPDFTTQMDVDMQECVKLRTELKGLTKRETVPGAGAQQPPTYNDMIVKACALALREHPRANASYRDGRLLLHSRVNVGVAVAARDALIVPTVFDADEKSLGEIARETRALAEKVRAGTITPPELGGATFTVSNLGMYGVKSFSAIINPPQVAILSVGALEPRAVVRDGGLVIRETLTLTLACDHRVLYGADAALLLARVRELLQAPSALTL